MNALRIAVLSPLKLAKKVVRRANDFVAALEGIDKGRRSHSKATQALSDIDRLLDLISKHGPKKSGGEFVFERIEPDVKIASRLIKEALEDYAFLWEEGSKSSFGSRWNSDRITKEVGKALHEVAFKLRVMRMRATRAK